ncbi:hypothetical protein LC653_39475 [Nostoc sp. CHAB 5784]|uniref:hypothetical protein n=1 Tax=Nostoc mirabile TaxID=2907820 RepID=UPI001E5D78E5|nr:hypothetical protein [Nostoc mirabile]MCC5669730.1 hypothetical protein [Nostoc mirabile CHAB5784]
MNYKIVKEKDNLTNPDKKDLNINIEEPKWSLNELVLSSVIKDEIDEIVAYTENQIFY